MLALHGFNNNYALKATNKSGTTWKKETKWLKRKQKMAKSCVKEREIRPLLNI